MFDRAAGECLDYHTLAKSQVDFRFFYDYYAPKEFNTQSDQTKEKENAPNESSEDAQKSEEAEKIGMPKMSSLPPEEIEKLGHDPSMEQLYTPLEGCRPNLTGRSLNAMRLQNIRKTAFSEDSFQRLKQEADF